MTTSNSTLGYIKEISEYLEGQPDKKAFLLALGELIEDDDVLLDDAHQTYCKFDDMMMFSRYELKNAKQTKASPDHIAFIEWKITALLCLRKFVGNQLEADGINPVFGN